MVVHDAAKKGGGGEDGPDLMVTWMGMTQVMLAVAAAEDAADAKSLKMLRCYRSNLGSYLRGMDPKDPRKD